MPQSCRLSSNNNNGVFNREHLPVKNERLNVNLYNWRTQLRKGLLELVVLNLLEHGRCHGYEMVQKLKHIEGLKIHEGNIYPILTRLQIDGLVKSENKPSVDGPPRKYFAITKSGRKILSSMNEHWDMIVDGTRLVRKAKV